MYKEPAKKKKPAESTKKETSTSGASLYLEDNRNSAAIQRKAQNMMQNYVPKHVIQPKRHAEAASKEPTDTIEEKATETHTLHEDAEHEQDVPVQLKTTDTSKVANDDSVIQRQIIPYQTTYKGSLTEKHKITVENIARNLDQRVQQAYHQSLHWQTLSGHQDKHVQNWYKMAKEYAKNPTTKEPKIVYARFGYSVEAIATANLNGKKIGNLTVLTQISHGHTRPDIVLEETNTKNEVAWLDITSEASIGHIEGKEGAGWRNRPFIYEIVYPKLKMLSILNATNNPYFKELGGLISSEKQIELDTKLKNEKIARQQFIKLKRDEEWRTGHENAFKKRKKTRDFFLEKAAEQGVNINKKGYENAYGALKHLGVVSGPFGFNRGDILPTNEGIRRLIDETSRKEIQQEQQKLYLETSGRILSELKNKISKKLYNQFSKKLFHNPTSRDISLALMAMKGAILDGDYMKLEHADMTLKLFTNPTDFRAKDIEASIKTLSEGPQEITHAAVMKWRNDASNKIKEAHELSEISKVQRNLIKYAKKQGWNLMNRPKQISKWFQQLADYPLNINAAKQVYQWLKNPQPFN
ncbi:MAG: hypothetical protein AAF611_17290 [Bacteroidota bacterium]